MKAMAELPSRVEKKNEPDIAFSCICSNEFIILISFNLILSYSLYGPTLEQFLAMINQTLTLKKC